MSLPMLMNYISYLVNSRHQIKKWLRQLDIFTMKSQKKKLGNMKIFILIPHESEIAIKGFNKFFFIGQQYKNY